MVSIPRKIVFSVPSLMPEAGRVRPANPAAHGHHLSPILQTAEASGTVVSGSLGEAVAAFESNLIQDALKTTRGNRARAARLLGTTERIINYKSDATESSRAAFAADEIVGRSRWRATAVERAPTSQVQSAQRSACRTVRNSCSPWPGRGCCSGWRTTPGRWKWSEMALRCAQGDKGCPVTTVSMSP